MGQEEKMKCISPETRSNLLEKYACPLADLPRGYELELDRSIGTGISRMFFETLLPSVDRAISGNFVFSPPLWALKGCVWSREFLENGFAVIGSCSDGDYIALKDSAEEEKAGVYYLSHGSDYRVVCASAKARLIRSSIEEFLVDTFENSADLPLNYYHLT